jgi:hypothetical protein
VLHNQPQQIRDSHDQLAENIASQGSIALGGARSLRRHTQRMLVPLAVRADARQGNS